MALFVALEEEDYNLRSPVLASKVELRLVRWPLYLHEPMCLAVCVQYTLPQNVGCRLCTVAVNKSWNITYNHTIHNEKRRSSTGSCYDVLGLFSFCLQRVTLPRHLYALSIHGKVVSKAPDIGADLGIKKGAVNHEGPGAESARVLLGESARGGG